MPKSSFDRLLLTTLLAAASMPALALDVDVQGLGGKAAENVANYMAELEAENYARPRLEKEITDRTRKALRVYGYYEPELDISFEREDGKIDKAIIAIQPGPRVRVTRLAIELRGDARDDEAYQQTLDDSPLKEGQFLRHGLYENLRSQLSTLALERGYFDSRFLDRRLEVRPWEQSARIYLTLDSGPRYVFGDVSYRGSQIEQERLRNMLPFDSGEPYLAGELAEYNQRLGETGWFRSIAIRPRLETGSAGVAQAERGWWQAVERRSSVSRGAESASATPLLSASAVGASTRIGTPGPPQVPVEVNLVPADRHQFEVGVGYATDVGPRLQFAWDQPWLNEDGDSLNHDLYLSAVEQEFSGEYLMPLDDPLRDRYELLYGLKGYDNEDTRSLEASVEVARRWRFDNDWIQRLYLRGTYADFTQADQDDQLLLYYPGISWARTRTRNPRFPTWGDRQRLSLEVSDTLWGSDATFVRSTLDTQWIRMLGDNNRFVGRLGIGAMSTDDLDNIPPSLRFFAGGDQSIRGYEYESLAPENEDGELVGGQQLFTASIEAQRRITGDWWGAAFVDTGNAFNDWWPEELATGAGLGVRWISPVGPIRLDIAHPFDNEDDWRLHFAIGPEF